MLTTILAAVKMAGAELPAFKALFDQAVKTLSPQEQQTAKSAYAAARAASNNAQTDFVNAGRGKK